MIIFIDDGGAAANEILADSPYAYWPISESSGTSFNDLGSGNNDLTLTGGALVGCGKLAANSTASIELDGESGYLRPSTHAGFQATGDFTFRCRLRMPYMLPAAGETFIIFSCGASGETAATNTLYQVGVENSGGTLRLNFFHEYGTGSDETGSVNYAFAAATTYDFAVTRNVTSNQYEFFINGSSIGTASFTNDPAGGTSTEFWIGGVSGAAGSSMFVGFMSEIAFFTSALSSARIAAHHSYLGAVQTPATTKYGEMHADSPLIYLHLNKGSSPYPNRGSGADTFAQINGSTSGGAALIGDNGASGTFGVNNVYAQGPGSKAAYQLLGDLTVVGKFYLDSLPGSGATYLFALCGVTGETLATNITWQVGISNSGGVYSIGAFHETGSGTNVSPAQNVTWPSPAALTPYVLHVTRDATAKTYSVYINGALLGTTSAYANNPTGGTSGTVLIGINQDQVTEFQGDIDEFALYGTKLSGDRISAQAAALA